MLHALWLPEITIRQGQGNLRLSRSSPVARAKHSHCDPFNRRTAAGATRKSTGKQIAFHS